MKDTKTVEDYLPLVGTIVDLGDDEYSVKVKLAGVRSVYGRIEAMIQPIKGTGHKWVHIGKVVR